MIQEITRIRKQGRSKIIGVPKSNQNLKIGDFVALVKVEDLWDKAINKGLEVKDIERFELNQVREKD